MSRRRDADVVETKLETVDLVVDALTMVILAP